MRNLAILLILLSTAVQADKLIPVTIETTLGPIVVELNATRAPKTTANFLRYVDADLFSNGRFHRTVTLKPDNQPKNRIKIEVIQAGLAPEREKDALPAIALERTSKTGLRHRDGTISMARLEPDTASSEFFICVGDQPDLDYRGGRNPDGQGFAAFGRVVKGMGVVRKIHRSRAQGQALTPPIRILNVHR